MTKPMIRIHNTETNEIINREMTDEEFTVYEADLTQTAARLLAAEQAATAKAALLAKLGITEEEARLLLS